VGLSLKADLFLVAVTVFRIFINMIVGNSVRQHNCNSYSDVYLVTKMTWSFVARLKFYSGVIIR
jgi:hypothetical protein